MATATLEGTARLKGRWALYLARLTQWMWVLRFVRLEVRIGRSITRYGFRAVGDKIEWDRLP